MKAIIYKDFEGIVIGGEKKFFPKGTEFEIKDIDQLDWVVDSEGKKVCLVYSTNYREYFAINDDGNGLIRGELALDIFKSGKQINERIIEEFPQYLEQNLSVLTFNNLLFIAPLKDLKRIKELMKPSEVK